MQCFDDRNEKYGKCKKVALKLKDWLSLKGENAWIAEQEHSFVSGHVYFRKR